MKFDLIKKQAESYEKDMTKFLRDLIALPGESCFEEPTVLRIKEEMEKVVTLINAFKL